LRNNIFLWSLLLFPVIVLAGVLWFYHHSANLEKVYLAQVSQDLTVRSRLLARECGERLKTQDFTALQQFCRQEAEFAGSRITVVAEDGRVVADSARDSDSMDNHANRPEISAVLRNPPDVVNPTVSTIRHSTTLGERLMYCAMPIKSDGKLYVLRLAFSIRDIDKVLRQFRHDMLWSVVLTALLTSALGYAVFRTVSRPVRQLTESATMIAAGNLECKLPVPERGMLRKLAVSLSNMAEELKHRISEISGQKAESDAIFSALTDGVIVLDMEGKVISINQAAKKIFNLKASAVGSEINSVVRNDKFAEFLADTLHEHSALEREFRFESMSGVRFLRLRSSVIHWGDRLDHLRIMIVIYDFTQIRQLENFRRDFIANVSHEIKTPLTVIHGAVEALQDGALEDKKNASKFMQIIALHAERLNTLVKDILSLSKLESKSLEDARDNMIKVDLSSIAESAMELAAANADEAKIKLKLKVDNDCKVKVDIQLMEQALFNLIDNAVRHSGEEKEIEVKISRDGDFARIDVTDSGIGIASEHLPRIFERFYRVDSARSRKAGGTGLGLAIVKHVAQLHNGVAEVASKPGCGSCFTIKIPCKKRD